MSILEQVHALYRGRQHTLEMQGREAEEPPKQVLKGSQANVSQAVQESFPLVGRRRQGGWAVGHPVSIFICCRLRCLSLRILNRVQDSCLYISAPPLKRGLSLRSIVDNSVKGQNPNVCDHKGSCEGNENKFMVRKLICCDAQLISLP